MEKKKQSSSKNNSRKIEEQIPPLKPHKNPHHRSMQGVHLLSLANTHQTPSSSLSFLAARVRNQRSTEHGLCLTLLPCSQLRRGTSETSLRWLWISAQSTGTRWVAQTPRSGICCLKCIFSILASSEFSSSFLHMQAMPLKGQKPRHQQEKQNLIHAALLTCHAGGLPDNELVLTLTIKSLPHVAPAQGTLIQPHPELEQQKATL